MEKRKKYIAYGSNLNIEQMERRCPTAKVTGKGELADYELLFRGSRKNAVATVEPKKGGTVPVLIWDIGPEDEKYLDIYEGYPRLYRKEEMEVRTEGGTEKIMAYVMNPGYDIGMPSTQYLNVIEKGYADAGFDKEILLSSVARCVKALQNESETEESIWHQQRLQ